MIHLLWLSLGIPVVLHLVHRRKARRLPFSTLRFLEMVDRRVARRHHLKRLFLLALRLLLLAAVIGALYRPMLRSPALAGADVPVTAALVLDNTCSMQAVDAGVTRFDRARTAALDVLDVLQRGDAACTVLVDAAGAPSAELTTGLENVREKLAAARCGYGTGEVADALRRALDVLRAGPNASPELYVFTDFQSTSWNPAAQQVPAKLPPDLTVFLVDVGGKLDTNLALPAADAGVSVQAVGLHSEIAYTVRNTGSRPVERELSLHVAGEKVAARRVQLAPGAEVTDSFVHVFRRAGPLPAALRMAADQFEPDDVRYLTVRPREDLRVLLVNGDPSPVPHTDETFFLALALEAPSRAGDASTPVRLRTVTVDDFPAQHLADYACVVLANVPRVPLPWAEKLRSYVGAGGGLILFMGDRVEPQSYNDALAGPAGLLPAPLDRTRDVEPHDSEAGFRIRSLAADHPLFHAVAGHVETDAVRVRRFMAVRPGEESSAASLVELDAGPLLMERTLGAGAVLLCTTAADLDWANLAARSFFVPVLHQMVRYASGAARRQDSVRVGMPYVLELPPEAGTVDVVFCGPSQGEPGALEQPLAAVTSRLEGGRNRAEFTLTRSPGVYRAVHSVGNPPGAHLFAVNVDPRESDTRRAEPEDVAAMLGAARVHVLRRPGELAQFVRRTREGLPLWDYLFALALLAALAEGVAGNLVLKR
jgi:hypothetical protein